MSSSESVLARLVTAWIENRDHPVEDERGAALEDVELSLGRLALDRLIESDDWDSRHASFDGIEELSVEAPTATSMRIVGAFYFLEVKKGGSTGHRMLPVDAYLTVEPGADSTVKVAGLEGLFEIPQSHHQLARGIEGAEWRHTLTVRLA